MIVFLSNQTNKTNQYHTKIQILSNSKTYFREIKKNLDKSRFKIIFFEANHK